MNEVVLPSGIFAHVRVLTVADIQACHDLPNHLILPVLVQRAATFDGEAYSLLRILQSPWGELAPVFLQVSKQLEKAKITINGVA